jgi:2,3-bisphosphoglycerate-independent phosphoglycerate mutase
MTHTSEPVPFIIYRGGNNPGNGAASYDEVEANATGLTVDGHNLMELLLAKE